MREKLDSMLACPDNGVLDFVIEMSSSSACSPQSQCGKVIGVVDIHNFEMDKEKGEIGYMLNRSCWGKGYMTEAMGVLLPHLWKCKPNLQRITAVVDPRNNGSMNVLKKLEFEETGRQEPEEKAEGKWHGNIFFALEREKGDRQSIEE